MKEDELRKILKEAAKKEEGEWVKTLQDPMLAQATQTIKMTGLLNTAEPVQHKEPLNWINILSALLAVAGLILLWLGHR